MLYVKSYPHFEKKIMVHGILKVLPIKGIYVEWKFKKYLPKRALSISLKLSHCLFTLVGGRMRTSDLIHKE